MHSYDNLLKVSAYKLVGSVGRQAGRQACRDHALGSSMHFPLLHLLCVCGVPWKWNGTSTQSNPAQPSTAASPPIKTICFSYFSSTQIISEVDMRKDQVYILSSYPSSYAFLSHLLCLCGMVCLVEECSTNHIKFLPI
jgi:hypothetical protein